MKTKLVRREQWGARKPRHVTAHKGDLKYITIHYLGAPTAANDPELPRMKGTQNYHMDTRKWSDIAYNYLVGASGAVYQGRGAARQNAADGRGNNSKSLSICALLGTKFPTPSDAMLASIQNLVWDLVDMFPSIERVRPHKSVRTTSCPGPVLTKRIKDGDFTLRRPIDADTEIVVRQLDVPSLAWQVLVKEAGLTPEDLRKTAEMLRRMSA